jgi:predicted transcriptional regulator
MPRVKNQDSEPTMIVELRASISESGATPYALARRAGIDESAIRKFVARTRSLSLDSAARLVEVLGLRVLRPTKPRRFPSPTRSRRKLPELVEVEVAELVEASELVQGGEVLRDDVP